VTAFTASILFLFIAAGLIALRFGGPPERLGAAIVLAWAASDVVYHTLVGRTQFEDVDVGHFVIDTTELVAITWLALRANRMWPLWAAAAQLICVTAHVATLIEPGAMRRAYWAMTQLPQYIQLGALMIGTLGHVRRERRRAGQAQADGAWRAV
jgi:hypothetical protein